MDIQVTTPGVYCSQPNMTDMTVNNILLAETRECIEQTHTCCESVHGS
jgi:hypothetical protein